MRTPWKPSTPDEDLAATDFENNPQLRAEVQRDTAQWLGGITQPEQYEVGGTVHDLDPKTMRGLMEADEE